MLIGFENFFRFKEKMRLRWEVFVLEFRIKGYLKRGGEVVRGNREKNE